MKLSVVPVLAPTWRPGKVSGVPRPKIMARLESSDMICSMMKATLGSSTCFAAGLGSALKTSDPSEPFTCSIP